MSEKAFVFEVLFTVGKTLGELGADRQSASDVLRWKLICSPFVEVVCAGGVVRAVGNGI